MAYYYYYQHQHTPSGSLSPVTTVGELTPPLPPLLLLPPSQHHLTLPLLTPILPSATTSVPMPPNETTIEHNQQHQLPTPNTFIRHCEDMGLFHDLQNIVVMSSLTGLPGDTVTTSIPVSTTPTLVTTSVSIGQPNIPNVCSSSSTGVITTMMANPFDETFKQAVLQQKKIVNSASENIFSNNNNDGDLNTPFIATTTVMDSTNLINNSMPVVTSVGGMRTTPIISAPVSVESITTTSTTVPQQQQQNLFVTSTEATAGGVLVMMVDRQQQHDNSIVSVQSQNQKHNHIEERQQQRFIIPATVTSSSAAETKSCHVQERHDDEGSNKNDDLNIKAGSETSAIKQTLKQNLLVKRSRQEPQKSSGISETEHELKQQQQQQNNDIDVNTINETNRSCNDNDQEDGENQKQQLKQKQKQDLLERNRSAAKRSRMKRKEKWELLFEENKRLKFENGRLRDIIAKLISRGYDNLQMQLPQYQIQQQKEITKKNKK